MPPLWRAFKRTYIVCSTWHGLLPRWQHGGGEQLRRRNRPAQGPSRQVKQRQPSQHPATVARGFAGCLTQPPGTNDGQAMQSGQPGGSDVAAPMQPHLGSRRACPLLSALRIPVTSSSAAAGLCWRCSAADTSPSPSFARRSRMADPQDSSTSTSRSVTPLQTVGAGALSLGVGALAGFSSHYLGE